MGAEGKKDMQAKARGKYREHYDLVRRITSKELLLEYRMGDGWEPLCEFLGKEVPALPFPNVNDQAMHAEQLAVILRRGLLECVQKSNPFAGSASDRIGLAAMEKQSLVIDFALM